MINPNFITDVTRKELAGIGINNERTCRICTVCGAQPSTVAADKPHHLEEEIKNAQRRLKARPGNPELQNHVHQLISRRNYLSRCCGAVYTRIRYDYPLEIWRQWLRRKETIVAAVRRQVVAQKIDPALYSDQDLLDYALRQIKGNYPNVCGRASDDLLMVLGLWGLGDYKTQKIVTIFEREQIRQEEQALAQNTTPLEQPALMTANG